MTLKLEEYCPCQKELKPLRYDRNFEDEILSISVVPVLNSFLPGLLTGTGVVVAAVPTKTPATIPPITNPIAVPKPTIMAIKQGTELPNPPGL